MFSIGRTHGKKVSDLLRCRCGAAPRKELPPAYQRKVAIAKVGHWP
jgi:hypothetical protein